MQERRVSEPDAPKRSRDCIGVDTVILPRRTTRIYIGEGSRNAWRLEIQDPRRRDHRAAACLVAAGAGIADTTNADPTGDAKGGSPDITQVVTSNDAAGVITFRITTVAPIIDSSIVGVDLDTDSNPGTGGGGFEYTLIAAPAASGS